MRCSPPASAKAAQCSVSWTRACNIFTKTCCTKTHHRRATSHRLNDTGHLHLLEVHELGCAASPVQAGYVAFSLCQSSELCMNRIYDPVFGSTTEGVENFEKMIAGFAEVSTRPILVARSLWPRQCRLMKADIDYKSKCISSQSQHILWP